MRKKLSKKNYNFVSLVIYKNTSALSLRPWIKRSQRYMQE
ncbi:hypothetical protein LEP1GSC060_0516 [Leptospira weilii serovar Ranarum str. ICFT]|uniref:Uncharacterized protein n=1 Tax=Leptospira weilii serovar Ranarum str. ICFT TaxID=1218598 RepID=N1WNF1_9LEPT|nr:hypothetical protein LEP1GSC060_0516 [Leptospira weilii serovar Ranarum str. ICFT]